MQQPARQSTPSHAGMRVELGDHGMVVSAVLNSTKDFDRLIQILKVNKVLFEEVTEPFDAEEQKGESDPARAS